MIVFLEGVLYRNVFEISPFRKDIGKVFALRQNYKDEGNDLMQGLVNLSMNSLYRVQKHKHINEFYKCKSHILVETLCDDNVLDCGKLPNRNYIVKTKKYDGLDGDNDVKNTLTSHLGAFYFN